MDDPDPRSWSSDRPLLTIAAGTVGPRRWVPLRFVGAPEDPCVFAPSTTLPGWARALERSQVARWRVGSGEYAGSARRLMDDDPAYRAALDRLVAEYGNGKIEAWFAGHVTCFQLSAVSTRDAGDLHSIEAFFDAAAPDYDRVVAGNRIDAWLRQESLAALLGTFQPGQRVLEIGCGTGLETIPLARAGVTVVATDLSGEMLTRLDRKAEALGLSDRIRTRKMAGSSLEPLLEEFGPGSFDGAFSDFGALNLDPDWPKVAKALAELVRPQGRIVLGVWNRVCLAELLLYSLALHPHRALSRLRSPVPPGQSRFAIPVKAQAPGPFLAALAPAFRLESLQALPFLVPPYDFLPHVPAPDRLLPLLESADRAVRGRFPFNRLGDHFLARLRRVGV